RRVCAFSAFITFGRLTVTNATAPVLSRRMFSYPMAIRSPPLRSGLLARDLQHGRLDDRLGIEGLVLRIALRVGDLVDDLEAADDLPEAGVLAVEVRRDLVHDEELARGRVRVGRARHREDAGLVLPLAELRLERARAVARAGAGRVAAL